MDALPAMIVRLLPESGDHRGALAEALLAAMRTPALGQRPGVAALIALHAAHASETCVPQFAEVLLALLGGVDGTVASAAHAPVAVPVPRATNSIVDPAYEKFWAQVTTRLVAQGAAPSSLAEAGRVEQPYSSVAGRTHPAHVQLAKCKNRGIVCMITTRFYDAVSSAWPDDQITGLVLCRPDHCPRSVILVFPIARASSFPDVTAAWVAAAEERLLQLLGTLRPAQFLFDTIAVRVVDVDASVYNTYLRTAYGRHNTGVVAKALGSVADATVMRMRRADAPNVHHVAALPELSAPAQSSPKRACVADSVRESRASTESVVL